MNDKERKVLRYILDRLSEATTWQAIGFIAGLYTAKASGMDWGAGAALGGVISAAIKASLPDNWGK